MPDETVGRATVSVVIPVHNGMPHLPETLASVLSQTRIPDEIVVFENGSTDGTAEWLAEHAPAVVRVVVQPTMVSAAANFTRAVQASTGDLVKLLCADDILEPTAIEVQSSALERHPGAVLAASQRTCPNHLTAVDLAAQAAETSIARNGRSPVVDYPTFRRHEHGRGIALERG